MARIKEYPSITSFDGTNDALAIEQTDGANNRLRKVSPAQLKQYMEAGDFEATGEVKDGHGNNLAITKVPNSFITLESGISITTNQLFKQGNHIFGWITFSFSAQKPNNLKLGVLGTDYITNYMVRMAVGLGTEAWASEYMGYAVKGTDNGIYINGYNNNIKSAHIHLDYVV